MKKKYLKIFMVIAIMFSLTGCGKKNNGNDNINVSNIDGVEAKTYVDYNNNEVIIYATNNTGEDIAGIKVEINYYDKNGEIVDSNFATLHDFKKGSKQVQTASLPYNEDLKKYVPEKIEVKVQKEDDEANNITNNNTKDIAYEVEEIDDIVSVTLHNNSGKNLSEVVAMIVLMKEDKPIYASPIMAMDFNANASYTAGIFVPQNDDESYVEYDRVDVVVNNMYE